MLPVRLLRAEAFNQQQSKPVVLIYSEIGLGGPAMSSKRSVVLSSLENENPRDDAIVFDPVVMGRGRGKFVLRSLLNASAC